MKQNEILNEKEIRKTITMLKPDSQLFEVRIISNNKKAPISGYFTDSDTLIDAFDTIDCRNANIYITLNRLKPELYSRIQKDCFRQISQTTSDSEVEYYDWLFIDLDPVRAAGISSSNEEFVLSQKLAKKICIYLRQLGFEEPVKAISGNGCHLLYLIQLQNTEENRDIVERCLKALSMMFDTEQVKVDTTNYNPARICKLHGTRAQKGANTADRPHRMSRILSDSLDIKCTQKMYLQKLADNVPKEAKQERYQQYSQSVKFNLEDFMAQNGMTYKEDSNDRAKIYKLDSCPFNPSHRNGDARIFEYSNGAIAFKCHHNSCSKYRWQEVRMLYDPGAYKRNEHDDKLERGWKEHNRNKQAQEVRYEVLQDISTMFRNARMIYEDAEPEHEFVRSGISVIDRKLNGLQKTGVSVVTGLRGSGKSTLIGQIINFAVNDEHNVVCYSGELGNKKYLNWLMLQAAGKAFVEASTRYHNGYGVRADARLKIVDWFGDHFWLYDNRFGNDFKKIEEALKVKLKEHKADICIIDNLMALDLSQYDKDKYDAQTKFVWALKELAELTNTHIIFVAHPRKANGFLRLDDISGSGNISNIVDNAFIVHRWNKDFEIGYKTTFSTDAEKDISRCTNVVEIAKDREYGTQDLFIPLWYEEQTKRLRNDPSENVVYRWDDSDESFEKADVEEIPF